ncbi:MAG: XrtA system polysaccharide deacetylase [Planctomycetaceae bacterium]
MSSTNFAHIDAPLARLPGIGTTDAPLRNDAGVTPPNITRKHLLTIGLEDYYHVGAFQKLIDCDRWDRFESRLERSTRTTLELLDRHQTKATFFVLGWVAEQLPELVREVAARGHEVASRGFYRRNIRELSRTEFKEDLARTREALEAATGQRVIGHRVADGWFQPDDLWTLEVLAEEGYLYDSSIFPMFRSYADQPWRRFVHHLETPNGPIWEVPPSTAKLLGFRVPIAGGNYFRQLPHTLLKRCVRSWDRHQTAPFVMYFHTWELDPEQPRISAGGTLTQIRHYRNLNKMKWVLEDYLSQYSFGSVADVMGFETSLPLPHRACLGGSRASALLQSDSAANETCSAKAREPLGQAQGGEGQTPVTIVIPCYNEEASLPYLSKTLEQLQFALAPKYRPTFLFVDDCSTDTTWELMHAVFAGRDNYRFVKHEQNGGVSKAILTGIEAADTDIVCSMDCDCSYDPLELKKMLPLLTDDVDLVSASPYHPLGHVRNVPSWRLCLSKGLSWLYRSFLPQKLHTWTSCFRVYRRSAVRGLELREHGFLGTAELVGLLSLKGSRIVEHPATLNVRIFGESKMKTVRTICGHLRLLRQLFFARCANRRIAPPKGTVVDPEGIAAISRGSERSADPRFVTAQSSIPEGCQQCSPPAALAGIPPGCTTNSTS